MTDRVDQARERIGQAIFATWDERDVRDLVRLMLKFADDLKGGAPAAPGASNDGRVLAMVGFFPRQRTHFPLRKLLVSFGRAVPGNRLNVLDFLLPEATSAGRWRRSRRACLA